MSSKSIGGISFEPSRVRPPIALQGSLAELSELECRGKQSTIRAAGSAGRRSSANIPGGRRYAWRGCQAAELLERNGDRITLVATDQDTTVRTIKIGLNGPDGLLVDIPFRDQLDNFCHDGVKVCEFNELAIDKVVRSERVLASLLSAAFSHAHHRVKGVDKLLVEVNPRRVHFYERVRGFKVLASARRNLRVNAPTVLSGLDLEYVHRPIAEMEGHRADSDFAGARPSLFPCCFSAHQEAGIARRLSLAVSPWSPANADAGIISIQLCVKSRARRSKNHLARSLSSRMRRDWAHV